MIFAIILLASACLLGLSIFSRFFPLHRGCVKIAGSVLLGNLIAIWMIYLLSLSFVYLGAKDNALNLSALSSISLFLLVFYREFRASKKIFYFKLANDEKILLIISIVFSTWLMFHTFGYNSGYLEISPLAFSDFGANIPLIRSFSLGNNIPTEYPLFAGERIRYHFLMYFQSGLLEYFGMPIDFALNIPSILYFASLICLIYLLGKSLFKRKLVGIFAVILFLFNGSFSFLSAFGNNMTMDEALNSREFLSFAPYRAGDVVSAFWNLNIYTNQRHLAFGYSLALLLVYLLLQPNTAKRKEALILMGVAIGLLPFWHGSAFLAIITLFCGFIVFHNTKKESAFILAVAAAVAFAQVLFIWQGTTGSLKPAIHIGYLLNDLSAGSFLAYWFMNIGLALPLMFIGFYLANKQQKAMFIIFASLFLLGNIIQFTPEVAANHKFFNLWLIFANFYVAFCMVKMLDSKRKFLYPAIIAIILLLTLSGVLDLAVIKNHGKGRVPDYADPLVSWIENSTYPDSVFLTSYQIYHPVGLAGRKVMLGWPYFAWSAGQDTNSRATLVKELYSITDKRLLCNELKTKGINFVVTGGEMNDYPGGTDNREFFQKEFYESFSDSRFSVYDVAKSCSDV